MTLFHPQVRAHHSCPLCKGPKPAGNLVCWPCHRFEKANNNGGYSAKAERLIDACEDWLTGPYRCQGCGQ